MWSAAGTNRRDRSTNGHRAQRPVPATTLTPPRASRARAISRAAAAARSPPTYSANGRTGLRSSLVMFRDQTVEQAHAITGAPAVVDLGFRRPRGGPGEAEIPPRVVFEETLQKLPRRDRAAIAAAGILHVG